MFCFGIETYLYKLYITTVKGDIMKGNAVVQEQYDKKRDVRRHFIYLPVRLVEMMDIKKGNLIEFEIENSKPDYIAKRKINENKPLFKASDFEEPKTNTAYRY